MLILTTALWKDQTPGSESVAGVTLLLTPGPEQWRGGHLSPPAKLPVGYEIDLLVLYEHAVDTKERSYAQAVELALGDLPEAVATYRESEYQAPAVSRREYGDFDWCLGTEPFASPMRAGGHLWSRVRRYSPSYWKDSKGRPQRGPGSVSETILEFQAGLSGPRVTRDDGDLALAWDQASFYFPSEWIRGRNEK